MDIDLFSFIERIFQGTILFVFKFILTAGQIVAHPLKNSLAVFARFESAQTQEVGPVTFCTICVLAFWAAVMALLLVGFEVGQTGVLAAELKSLHAESLRVPIRIVAIVAFLSIVGLELLYRVLAAAEVLYRERVPDDESGTFASLNEASARKLRAVGLYTTGIASLPFPLAAIVAGIVLNYLGLSPSSLLRGQTGDRTALVVLGVLLLSPCLCAFPVLHFVRTIGPKSSRLSRGAIAFGATYVATVAVFSISFFAVVNAQLLFTSDSRPVISDLQCLKNDEDSLIALVEIKSLSYRADLLDTNLKSWHIVLEDYGFDKSYFAGEARKIVIDGKENPSGALLKPTSVEYAMIWFELPKDQREKVTAGLWGWCEVFTGYHYLDFKKMMVLGSLWTR
jgi:hypothetical protein